MQLSDPYTLNMRAHVPSDVMSVFCEHRDSVHMSKVARLICLRMSMYHMIHKVS